MLESRREGSPRGPDIHTERLQERLLSMMRGGSVFMADRYTLDGVSGKVASFYDLLDPTHLLQQATSAQQVAAPTATSALRDAAAAAFASTQWYDSNRAASTWKYLHDGTGCFVLLVLVPTDTSTTGRANQLLASFTTSTTQAGLQVDYRTQNGATTERVTVSVANATATPAIDNTSAGDPLDKDKGTYISFDYIEGASPEWSRRTQGTLGASGATAAAPSAANPPATLRLGAKLNGQNGAIMSWAAAMFRPSPLSVDERNLLSRFLNARYGAVP